ncbi:MAG: glycosyltransferase family 4 protein [Planctomycetota bacterium]
MARIGVTALSTVAYLINQYPKISHSFIRREIVGVEAAGISVLRFTIRPTDAKDLRDPADLEELKRTRAVLSVGLLGLCAAALRALVTRPWRFFAALRLAIRSGWRAESGLVHHLAYLCEACVLQRWLADAQVTHLHAHFPTNSTAVAMLCHTLGGPSYSFTVHGQEIYDFPGYRVLAEKARRAEFAVAISDFGRSQLYRWCRPADWRKFHVIRCGLDRAFLEQRIAPLPREPRLVAVGRFAPDKGHLLLIEAARQLKVAGIPFELVLVGDGELRPQIENFLREHGLEMSVRLAGWATEAEVRAHLVAARALVLPSFAEGLPVVIMEAFALGRPVVSTHLCGIPELVEPGANGWLVPAGNPEALAGAMRALLATPLAELERMGAHGAARARARHDSEAEATKLAALFSQLQPGKS